MKFLVLALCVCAASAASVFKPYNTVQTPTEFVSIPGVAAKSIFEPVVQASAKAVFRPVAEVAPKAKFDPAVVSPKNAYYSGNEAEAPVVRSQSEVNPEGFQYEYETANGIAAQATGALKKVGDSEAITFQGSYKYYAPDGTPVEVAYVADENGFQPQSDLLPVAPAIPDAILRSLAFIAEQSDRKV